MKKLSILLFLIQLTSCNPVDCFETTGDIIQKEIAIETFSKINVGKEVSLILQQGNTQHVIIETGENLIDNVNAIVKEDILFLTDENSCNLNREYAVTKVYITSPNIVEIRSNTARAIISKGKLNFDELTLISEDYNNNELNIGDFDLNINSQQLKIISNGNSVFMVKGNTNKLQVHFYSGSCRFIGNELIANEVNVIHKSSNDILVYPIISLAGKIHTTGDLISYNQPEQVNIETFYTGKLIFK